MMIWLEFYLIFLWNFEELFSISNGCRLKINHEELTSYTFLLEKHVIQ